MICQPRLNTSRALPRKAIQVERRCPRLWRPRLWRPRPWRPRVSQGVGTSNRFQQVRAQFFFRVVASTARYTAPCGVVRCRALRCGAVLRSAVRCRAVSCSAVRCRAVPRCAVLCRALLCFLFHTYQTTTLSSIQSSWREPACRRAFNTAVFILFFFGGGGVNALPVYSDSSSTAVLVVGTLCCR